MLIKRRGYSILVVSLEIYMHATQYSKLLIFEFEYIIPLQWTAKTHAFRIKKHCHLEPRAHVASNFIAIHLRLDVRNGCDGLQQKLQYAEYSTCNPLITQPIFIRLSNRFH